MNDPDLYDAYSEFQRRDARELIPYLISHMSWVSSEKILDFGCGSGYVTKNILVPALEAKYPDGTRHIHGVDISLKMVEFAAAKYQDGNITYLATDMTQGEVEFPDKFDKILSFHVLHWIADHRKLLETFHRLLKVKGEIGFYFLSNSAVFSVYDAMSKNPVWKTYLGDAKSFIPKTFYSQDPATDMSDLMRSIGYSLQECTTFTRSFNFHSVDEMIDAAMAANPFIGRIPPEMHSIYKEDFRKEFTPFLRFTPNPQWPLSVEVDYQILFVRGFKL